MRLLLTFPLLLCAFAAQADTLSDFKTALQRFSGELPLKGQVLVRSESRNNEGKDDAEVKLGVAHVGFDDGPHGLRLHYPQSMLAKAAQEDTGKRGNPKAETPTITGLAALSYREVRSMTQAAQSLQSLLSNAQFKSERADTWQGQPARLLSFQLPQTEPNKYVKEFNWALDVWVGADGVPLAARSLQKFSGRAYVVVSFDMSQEDEWHYTVSGDRLVALKKRSKGGGSGGGEKGQTSKTLSLQLG